MHPACLLLPSVVRGVVLPTFALLVLLRFLHPSRSYLGGLPLGQLAQIDLAWLAFVALTRSAYRKAHLRDQRRRLGVDAIPAVRGWLPWNLDVSWALLFPREEQYVGRRDGALSAKLGSTTYNLRLLGRDIIFTTDPSNVKAILSSDFASFDKGPTWRAALDTFLGGGIFNSDGAAWKAHRALTRPFFARDRISDFSCFERHVDDLVAVLDADCAQGRATDAQDLFGRYTLDAAVDFLFGAQTDSLKLHSDGAGQRAAAFVAAFNAVQKISTARLKLGPLWPVSELGGDRMQPHMDVINAYLQPIVEAALDKKQAAAARGEKAADAVDAAGELVGELGHSLLDSLLEQSGCLKFVQNELLNILLAARDTTAALLTFTCYCLALHPAVRERLVDEIRAAVLNGAVPTPDDIREMKYLRAVLNEVLRLYPSVPGNFRESTAACVLPCRDSGVPKFMSANTTICFMTFNTHRSPAHWGDDAGRFDPDRWLDERAQRVTQNPFIFHPFSGGPRICLGQQFAYNEASFVLIRLLQRFPHLSFAPDAQPAATRRPAFKSRKSWPDEIRPATELILLSQGGLHLRFAKDAPAEVS